MAVTAAWAYVLLDRSPDWYPGLKVAILVLGLVAGAMIAAGPLPGRALATAVAATALFAVLAGPAAYTLETVATAHSGAIPSAGPSVVGTTIGFGGPGGALRARGGFGQPPAGAFVPPQGGPEHQLCGIAPGMLVRVRLQSLDRHLTQTR